MGWDTSNRRQRLPANWAQLVERTKRRAGGMCEAQGCHRKGSECDHIVAGDDHRQENLQWLCWPCHRRKTVGEAAAARRARSSSRRRPPERHPGLKRS